MTEMRDCYFCRILAPPNANPPPPPPLTPKYLTILMTERRGAIVFCRILAPPNDPPPPGATILNYLTDREGRALPLVGFWRLPMPPPPPPTSQYLTILMTERGAPLSYAGLCPPPPVPQTPQYLTILQTERERALPLVGFWRLPMPPPSPDATILNYLNDSEGGAIILCRTLPPPRSTDATILNDLNDSERGWGRQYTVRS